MSKRGIVFIATVALIVLAGCATHQATTAAVRSTESDVGPAARAADLVGTWSGWFGAVGAPGLNMAGTMVLEIRDDGTYTMTTQRGGSIRNDSGIIVANGRTVTLRSSSGASSSLTRRGDKLYSLSPGPTGDYSVQTSIVRESGVLASPASEPKSR